MNESTKSILNKILVHAQKQGCTIAIVGGIVRDQIMGLNLNHTDYDLCVEGDALTFAETLLPQVAGDIKRYPNFRSATIIIEGLSIDFVSARTEIYQKPGALPTVTWSTIDKDLPRRDFTVNAIALLLEDFLLGQTNYIDVTGGIADIHKKSIAIIHEKSFLDDPTRLFRAVRYEKRLNFHQSDVTLQCFQEALRLDALNTISQKRIFNEIQKILDEENWFSMFLRLHELSLKLPLLPSLCFRDIISSLQSFQPRERFEAFLKAACSLLTKDEALLLLQQLSLSRELRDRILG